MKSLIQAFVDFHDARQMDPNCKLIAWLKSNSHIDAMPEGEERQAAEDALRLEMLAHPNYSPTFSVLAIQVLADYPEPRKSKLEAIYLKSIMDVKDTEQKMVLLRMLGGSRKRPAKMTQKSKTAVAAEQKKLEAKKVAKG